MKIGAGGLVLGGWQFGHGAAQDAATSYKKPTD